MATKVTKRVKSDLSRQPEIKNNVAKEYTQSTRRGKTINSTSPEEEEIADLLDTDEDKILENYDRHLVFSK